MRTREGRIKSWKWHMVDKKYCIVEIVERQVRKNVTYTSWGGGGGGRSVGGSCRILIPPPPPTPVTVVRMQQLSICFLSFFLFILLPVSLGYIFFSYTITLKWVIFNMIRQVFFTMVRRRENKNSTHVDKSNDLLLLLLCWQKDYRW